MDNGKITISMEEVNRATPVPGSTPPPVLFPDDSSVDPTQKHRRIGCKIGIAVAVLAILAIACIGISAAILEGQTRTVQEYRAEIVQKYNEKLADPSSSLLAGLRERVQAIDPAMTMTSAEITKCEVQTLDGTDSAGRKDRNIGKLLLDIRANWDHRGVAGHTDIAFTLDGQTHIVENSTIVDSTPIEKPTGQKGEGEDDDFGRMLFSTMVEAIAYGFFAWLLE